MRRQMVTTMYNNVLSNVTFDIGLHEVCVRTGGGTLRQPNFLGWIVYQIFLPVVLRFAARVRELRY